MIKTIWATEDEIKAFLEKLSNQELCEAFEGDKELSSDEEIVEDNNTFYKLCDRFENERKKTPDVSTMSDALIYEMATRFKNEKSPGN